MSSCYTHLVGLGQLWQKFNEFSWAEVSYNDTKYNVPTTHKKDYVSKQNNDETKTNKAFIDIRLGSGLATPLAVIGWWWAVHASPYGPLRPNVTRYIKPEVYNVSQGRQRSTEPWPRDLHRKSWRAVQRFQRYARGQTGRQTQTDRQTDRNTPLP